MKVTVRAELWIDETDGLAIISLHSTDPENAKTLDAIMKGTIKGMEYCTDRVIRPVSHGSGGGASEVHIGFIREEFWRRFAPNGTFAP